MHVHCISGRNVNHVLPIAVTMFRDKWQCIHPQPSRGGKDTLEHFGPVATTYEKPCERVLFSPIRDANPFFHFFEALWILAGRNDVEWLSYFLKNIAQFSDDSQTFHGAYGHRLRFHFDHDQIVWLVQHLTEDRYSRRAVLYLSDGQIDHEMRSKDIPCNLSLVFQYRADALHLTVYNRSNDMVWGAYGANVVQFSTILELVAAALEMHVGTYTQISNSFHVYTAEPSWQRLRDELDLNIVDPYEAGLKPYPIMNGITPFEHPLTRLKIWDTALKEFIHRTGRYMRAKTTNTQTYVTHYFDHVAVPLFNAFTCYRAGDIPTAMVCAQHCDADDWKVAAMQWLQRRKK